MQNGWRVGHLRAVPLYIQPGAWVLILLVAWALAGLFFPLTLPALSRVAQGALALLTSLLFAATLVAHEVGHTTMAAWRGLRAEGVALCYFGAVTWFEEEPARPLDEALVALAGPAVSALIALGAAGVWMMTRGAGSPTLGVVAPVALFLAQMNVLLLLFNSLPLYPMDGGRALHALLWALLRDPSRSMRATAWATKGLALLVLAGGAWVAITLHHAVLLLGMAALSWFLYASSTSTLHRFAVRQRLAQLRVGQLMRRNGPTLQPSQSLQEGSVLMMRGASAVPVMQGDEFLGLLTHAEVRLVAHQQRASIAVRQVMRPATLVPTLSPDERADVALRSMDRARLPALPVLELGRLVGLLSQGDLVGAVHFAEERPPPRR